MHFSSHLPTLSTGSVFAYIGLTAFASAQTDYASLVNPFIGSEGPNPGQAYGGGDTFVGAALPFGVVKLGIDTHDEPTNISANNGGYTPQGNVTGISLLHESGTGGGPKGGFPAQMPLTTINAPVNILDNQSYWQSRDGGDTAGVGYYKTNLQNGITVELSASRHAGIMQYTFPADERHVLVDLSHYLPNEGRSYDSQFYTGGEIAIQSGEAIYTGFASVAGGWNLGPPVTVYFCGEFETPPDQVRTFTGRNTFPVGRHYRSFDNATIPEPTFGNDHAQSGPLKNRVGALFTWNGASSGQLRSRLGISFISTEKACTFKEEEIPTWNLNDTVQSARNEWNRDVFSKTKVPTGPSANHTRLTLLYSSLYFMHLIPSDRSGENPLWSSDEPYWDDFYTLWDFFRNTVSLYHLIQPSYYESMIRALIDIWRYEGYMPDGRSGNYNGLTQGGSNADNVLADAYVKGLRGGINWADGYAAMKKDAEVRPFYDFNPVDSLGSVKEGRGALDDWLSLGFVSCDQSTRSVSRTAEYAVNDFAVSQVAAGEGSKDADKYLNRSAGWQLSWNHNATSRNFTGFLAPRFANGSFNTSYDLTQCGDCNWADVSYEATPFEYSFSLSHDVETVIKFMGGPSRLEERLDYIFQPDSSNADLGPNAASITTIMNIGDEPDFLIPYLYNFVNNQAKSVERSRALANQYFRNANYGLPGNSDAGALNSWLIWQMIGLYPVATQPVYLLASPWFEDINMTINTDKTLRIRTSGLDDGDGRDGFYVQGVSINGQTWTKNWFEHGDMDIMTQGGDIEFKVGSPRIRWETGDVPPSPGHVEL